MANIPLIYVDQKKAWGPAVENRENSKVKKQKLTSIIQKKELRKRHYNLQKHLLVYQASNA